MKPFLIFTLYLISGPVGSINVIGYSGGTVIMTCKKNRQTSKAFCKKMTSSTCESKLYTTERGMWVNRDRLYLYEEFSDKLVVLYRQLVPEDTGSYQCSEGGAWSQTVILAVKTDLCCLGPTNMTGYLGETVTIRCSYPEEFLTQTKYLYKLKGPDYSELISTSHSQSDRFSISEDRSSRVISVRISDVGEEDGGDYFCGVKFEGQLVEYVSLFTEIQLQVTARGSSGIIITVSISAVLLLIGGLTLIFYKLRHSKAQGSVSPTTATGTSDTTDGDYMIMRSRPASAWLQSTTDSTPKPTGQIQSTIASTSKPTNQIPTRTVPSKPANHIIPTRPAPPKPTNQKLPSKISTPYANDQIKSTTTSTLKPNEHIQSHTASTLKPTDEIHPVKSTTPKPIIASNPKSTNQIHPTKPTTPKPTHRVHFNIP